MCQYMNIWLNKSILSPGVGVRQFPLWNPLRTSYSQEGQAFLYFTRSVCVSMCIYLCINVCVHGWCCMAFLSCLRSSLWVPPLYECHLSLLLPHFHVFITELLYTIFVFLVQILILGIIRFRFFFSFCTTDLDRYCLIFKETYKPFFNCRHSSLK